MIGDAALITPNGDVWTWVHRDAGFTATTLDISSFRTIEMLRGGYIVIRQLYEQRQALLYTHCHGRNEALNYMLINAKEWKGMVAHPQVAFAIFERLM